MIKTLAIISLSIIVVAQSTVMYAYVIESKKNYHRSTILPFRSLVKNLYETNDPELLKRKIECIHKGLNNEYGYSMGNTGYFDVMNKYIPLK